MTDRSTCDHPRVERAVCQVCGIDVRGPLPVEIRCSAPECGCQPMGDMCPVTGGEKGDVALDERQASSDG